MRGKVTLCLSVREAYGSFVLCMVTFSGSDCRGLASVKFGGVVIRCRRRDSFCASRVRTMGGRQGHGRCY